MRPALTHLALAVRDQTISRHFYETYFGFDEPAHRYPDGVLMLRNADGFSLALGPREDGPVGMPRFFHFGFRAESPADVRAMRDRLAADGVEIVKEWEEERYVSLKCRDPDGHVVEYAWEVPEPDPNL